MGVAGTPSPTVPPSARPSLQGEPSGKVVTALGVVAPPPIQVECEAFTGPLGTLFALVRDHKVDLLGVPLGPVCKAYLAYLATGEGGDLDEAAAALAALAYLLERKAWRLLPVPESEPEMDEPMEEIDPTVGEFAEAISALREWQAERERLFFRTKDAGPDPYELPYKLDEIAPGDLARALERLLRRAEPEEPRPLNRPRRSLAEQIEIVHAALGEGWTSLGSLVPEPFTREEAVYWFLSLLELVRVGRAKARLGDDDVEFARG